MLLIFGINVILIQKYSILIDKSRLFHLSTFKFFKILLKKVVFELIMLFFHSGDICIQIHLKMYAC